MRKEIENIEWDIIHKLPDYHASKKKGSIRKIKELLQKYGYDKDFIETIGEDFCQGFDAAKNIIIEICKEKLQDLCIDWRNYDECKR